MKRLCFSMSIIAMLASLPVAQVAAGVLRVASDESGRRVRVFDGTTGSAASADATLMTVQAGTVSADPLGNRVFFIGNQASAQSLYQLNYTTTNEASPLNLPATQRITHMEWDGSGSARLLGVAIDPSDDSVGFVSIVAGVVTDLGMPTAACCVFRIGVSAFRASDDSLFLVGRRSADSEDQLFRFTMNPLALAQVVAIPVDLRVSELNVNNSGQLVGLAWSEAAAATRAFTTDAALTISLLGSGIGNCCFVMAGAAAIDAGNNTLATLGPDLGGLQPRPWTFDLATGAINDGFIAVGGAGLFFDTTAIVDVSVLFADSFE